MPQPTEDDAIQLLRSASGRIKQNLGGCLPQFVEPIERVTALVADFCRGKEVDAKELERQIETLINQESSERREWSAKEPTTPISRETIDPKQFSQLQSELDILRASVNLLRAVENAELFIKHLRSNPDGNNNSTLFGYIERNLRQVSTLLRCEIEGL